MKKLFCFLLFAFVFLAAQAAMAADITFVQTEIDNMSKRQVIATVTADGSGNVAAIEIPGVVGLNLFDIPEIYSATDSTFTVILTSQGSTGARVPFINREVTTATTGTNIIPSDRHTMINNPILDVTGLTATEVCRIVLIWWR